MDYTYKPQGVCSRRIQFSVEDGVVRNVSFEGGCNGNSKGVAALVEGMKVEEAVRRMRGITCGYKSTSCPDQLARALELAQNSEASI